MARVVVGFRGCAGLGESVSFLGAMGRKRYLRGKERRKCVECSPGPHGRLQDSCAACKPCPQGKLESQCAAFTPYPYGKHKDSYAVCTS